MTDSASPTHAQDDLSITDPSTTDTGEQTPATAEDSQDTAYAQVFRMPTSLETSPDGNWLVWLQPGEHGDLELWLSGTTEGSEPHRLDLPFVPVEDRDPESGRLLRGPQFSPDSTRIAMTGMHPDGDRTAIWIVPMSPGNAAMLEDAPADTAVAMEGDEPDIDTPVVENGEEPVSDTAAVANGDGSEFEPESIDDASPVDVEAEPADESTQIETIDVVGDGFHADADLLTEYGDDVTSRSKPP